MSHLLTNLRGHNLLSNIDTEGSNIKAMYNDDEILSIPFKKIANTALYNNQDIAIDIPFEDYVETDDVCTEMRFFVPPVMDEDGMGRDYTLLVSFNYIP